MTLKTIAENIMFSGIKESDILQDWEYRKGKTLEDVKHAIKKGLTNGRGRTEWELEFIELYLADVLKKRGNRKV